MSRPEVAASPASLSTHAVPCDDFDLDPAKTLLEVLASVPDPRSPLGRRHPIGALLALLVVSFAAGRQTVKDAVLLGRHERGLRRALGFHHPKCPSSSTYTRLFENLPIESVRKAIAEWLSRLVADWCQKRGRSAAVCVDGKTLRGAGVHTLNIFVQDFWVLLDQYEVDVKANEMSTFRERLGTFCERYPFVTILTFDALFCEQQTMRALTKNNRMGIFQVKENQPETHFRLERWFAALPQAKPDAAETGKKWGLHRHARAMDRARAR